MYITFYAASLELSLFEMQSVGKVYMFRDYTTKFALKHFKRLLY